MVSKKNGITGASSRTFALSTLRALPAGRAKKKKEAEAENKQK